MESGLYKHYKGGLYYVFDTAIHSETGEEMVIYKGVTKLNDQLFIRPKTMFEDVVILDGEEVGRFEKWNQE